jgi:hypothetical protein
MNLPTLLNILNLGNLLKLLNLLPSITGTSYENQANEARLLVLPDMLKVSRLKQQPRRAQNLFAFSDATLIALAEPEQVGVQMRVSSSHLTLASPYFKRMPKGDWGS